MHVRLIERLADVPPASWNALNPQGNPFLRHEFLSALERHECVGPQYGWMPQHLAAYDEQGRLLGAVPMYEKDNSYGELVFDWSWADAYRRAGLRYYPKLVVAVPYTPATGPRILVAPGPAAGEVATALVEAALERARSTGVSSLHWLFPDPGQAQLLERQGHLRRLGCQFHWENPGYRDFDDFLGRLSSAKRKKLKRERRHTREAGIEFDVLHGNEMSERQWETLHDFYRSTFERKSGIPTLSLPFFLEISRTMGESLVLVLARHGERHVAGAINLRGPDTLYGRHWGCSGHYHSLHFEACYYQGIEYCIAHGLRRFEPGAQGEHKLSRGFLPTPTWSMHWIARPEFRRAIADFLVRERRGMEQYMQELAEHSPYRDDAAPVVDAPQP